jgi:hypothetical protein
MRPSSQSCSTFKGEGTGAIIRIMLQNHDRIWNTGALLHNHAAFLKVRALVPSSGLCFKFMTGCAWKTGALHHNHAALLKVRALVPSSGSCFKSMTGYGIQVLLITIMQHF